MFSGNNKIGWELTPNVPRGYGPVHTPLEERRLTCKTFSLVCRISREGRRTLPEGADAFLLVWRRRPNRRQQAACSGRVPGTPGQIQLSQAQLRPPLRWGRPAERALRSCWGRTSKRPMWPVRDLRCEAWPASRKDLLFLKSCRQQPGRKKKNNA